MARRFCLSVLVHEHFHAAVATGLDSAGGATLGAEVPERWQAANPLNESLAVWCEHHFYRTDPEMLILIDQYITRGTYPTWPYQGGTVIEWTTPPGERLQSGGGCDSCGTTPRMPSESSISVSRKGDSTDNEEELSRLMRGANSSNSFDIACQETNPERQSR